MVSSILTSLIVATITYLVLYKCCSIICEDKHMSYDDLIKEYQVSGLLRIVLDTFKIVFDVINQSLLKYQNNNIVKNTLYKLLFQSKYPAKPILQYDRSKDKELLFSYLIELLKIEDNDNKTDNFKHSVESIWQNKWSFFGYSSYISSILCDIGDICYKHNLPIITFLITYNDDVVANVSFQDRWRDGENGWLKAGLEKGIKSDNVKFKIYMTKMIEKINEYQQILEQIKLQNKQ